MSEDSKGMNILSVVAIALAVVALAVGAVLPQAGDLNLIDLNDVKTNNLLSNQTVVYNGTYWINSNFTTGLQGTQGIPGVNGTNGTNASITFGWDDLNFPALSLAKSAANAPNQGLILASGSIEGLLFDGVNKVNEVYSSGEILHNYKQGSDLYPHVHWMASTAASGNVTWFLEYDVVSVLGVYSAPKTMNITQSTTSVAWVHHMAEFPAINGTGLTIGSQIIFRLYRNATDPTDTYGANVALLSFGIHYQMDSIGSVSRTQK
jgi:hypothetical protein